LRASGEIIAVAPCSATVQAPLAQWHRWTGLPFDCDGELIVPGALAPVLVSTALDIGVYVEPNVWVLHSLRKPDHARLDEPAAHNPCVKF
jgi:hypothetical protein